MVLLSRGCMLVWCVASCVAGMGLGSRSTLRESKWVDLVKNVGWSVLRACQVGYMYPSTSKVRSGPVVSHPTLAPRNTDIIQSWRGAKGCDLLLEAKRFDFVIMISILSMYSTYVELIMSRGGDLPDLH